MDADIKEREAALLNKCGEIPMHNKNKCTKRGNCPESLLQTKLPNLNNISERLTGSHMLYLNTCRLRIETASACIETFSIYCIITPDIINIFIHKYRGPRSPGKQAEPSPSSPKGLRGPRATDSWDCRWHLPWAGTRLLLPPQWK